MQIVLAGGSGFLGRALQRRLQADGHAVGVLSRNPRPGVQEHLPWEPDGTAGHWARVLNGIDVLINLAGAGVADRRWSEARKAEIRESRIRATRSLVLAMQQVAVPPRVFVSGSAIGYYGPRGDELVTEDSPPGDDFLARVCVEWEEEANRAGEFTRLVIVRTGIVLHPSGGALAQMLLPFRLGIGGPIGSGRQYMSWIHIDDWIDLVSWTMSATPERGPFNATAPNPVTNAEFARSLGRALKRPAFLPTPTIGLRVLFGELADTLLTGQRAIPARATAHGFRFTYQTLDEALRAML